MNIVMLTCWNYCVIITMNYQFILNWVFMIPGMRAFVDYTTEGIVLLLNIIAYTYTNKQIKFLETPRHIHFTVKPHLSGPLLSGHMFGNQLWLKFIESDSIVWIFSYPDSNFRNIIRRDGPLFYQKWISHNHRLITKYSKASLIQTPLIQIIYLSGHMSGNQLWLYIWKATHLSGYSVIRTVSLGMKVSG